LSQGDSEVFLAMSFFYEDNRDMALKILKGATIKYPKSGLVWRSRGFIYYQEKSYELASQDLGVAAALNQQNDEALILLARSFFEIGKFEEARAAYFLAVLLSREYRFEFISKQKDLERKGKLELAAQYDETLRKADSWGQ
jgi:tetratricopeptide (TPR) repeat protein